MPESDAEKLDVFRELHVYALDYLSGALWLLAFTLFRLPAIDFDRIQAVVVAISDKANWAIGFTVVVGGVILPYCIGSAFKPLTVLLTGYLFRYRFFNPAVEKTPEQLPLFKAASEIIARRLGEQMNPVQPGVRQLIIGTYDAALERRLTRALAEASFRASALLPSALVVGGFLYRVIPAPLHLAAGPLTLLIFIMGVRATNYAAYTNQLVLNVALVLSDRDASQRASARESK